ncbi:MAG: hypothetical protein HRT43_00890 [Campylobacteraceae bacterium]|nr:hypothetical protein [Campylobacteraceae bacterium]
MKNTKKSFALLMTILFMMTFSFLSLYILEIKTFRSETQTKQHQQLQAAFYLSFAKNFIHNLELNNKDETCVNTITIENNNFDIYAHISYISKKLDCINTIDSGFDSAYTNGVAVVDLYVKSRSSIFKIKLHERFLKKL